MKTPGDGLPTGRNHRSNAQRFARVILLLALACLGLWAFYAFENQRGKRAWSRYVALRNARVNSPGTGLASSAPAAEPETTAALEKEWDKLAERLERAYRVVPSGSDSEARHFVDLGAWAQALTLTKSVVKIQGAKVAPGDLSAAARAQAAPTVLEAFVAYRGLAEKLEMARQDPRHPYPFGYADRNAQPWITRPIPSIFPAINFCRHFRVKLAADLALGNGAEALKDLEVMLCLSDSLREEPILVAALGSLACRSIALLPVWEGLAERRFSESELRHLQQLMASKELINDFPRIVEGERAMVLPYFDQARKTRKWLSLGSSARPLALAHQWIPAGWIQLDKLNYSRWMDAMLAAGAGDSRKQIRPGALEAAQQGITEQRKTGESFKALLRHTAISSLVMPSLTELSLHLTAVQVTTDQVRLAAALELFYHAHARYPGALAELVPDVIAEVPIDPISGDPYQYAREANGRYRLWCVGWNEKDDRGAPGDTLFDQQTGDWVWQYPLSSSEAAPANSPKGE